MTHTHRDVTFKISGIILTCVFSPLKSFEPLKSYNYLNFSIFYKELAKLALWRDFFSANTSKHLPPKMYSCIELIFVQEFTI